jgi:CheY-like chemotaxis protein
MTNLSADPVVVLLVDDQRFVGAALSRLLAGEDIQLHCCCDGLDAVAQATAIKPGVILQDLMMPGIEGLALLGLYRANPTTASTPVIVLSGNDNDASRTAAAAAGAADYLVKLPTKDVLLACIRRHVMGPSAHAVAPAVAPEAAQGDADETLDPIVMAAFRQGPGSADFTRMLIDQFVQEADTQVETLRDAARRQDAAVVKASAHGLKGSSLIMGAKRLAAVCARLEKGLENPTEGVVAPALMASLNAELVRVRRALAAERKTLTQPAVITIEESMSKQHSVTTHS